MKEWISNNAYWLFDGIGVVILTTIIGLFLKKDKKNKKKNISINQSDGKKSINIQNNDFRGDFNDRDDNRTKR